MIWLLAILVAFVLVWALSSGRRTTTDGQVRGKTLPESSRRNLHVFDHFIGTDCIFEEGLYLNKVRVMQIEPDDREVKFTFKLLKAEGLSSLTDENLFLSATWPTMSFSDCFIHAHYINWKLYADRDLVNQVCAEARLGVPLKALQRTLLEYRMQHA